LVDSKLLRNRRLRVAAKRYAKDEKQYRSLGENNAMTLNEFNAYAKSKGGCEVLKTHPEWF